MKKSSYGYTLMLVLSIFILLLCFTNCKKTENPIKFPLGTFPDSTLNLAGINSAFDDYNVSLFQINTNLPIVFSSNRRSSGLQFDLEQANLSFNFDQTYGTFGLKAEMTNDAFLDKLINKAKTSGNDFGPYRLYSSFDGFEYLLLASANGTSNLDLYYLKNQPAFGSSLPNIDGPYPIKLLNTSFDDAYICFDFEQDSAYFTSNRDGNFDIYLIKRPADKDLATWFNMDYTVSTKVDSINSIGHDKCPFVFKNIMVFSSDRQGGLGGFDLYYSIFRHGKWSSPINMGPGINSSSDEYRPVLGYFPEFTNLFLMFSSNKPGGKGGYDLYFTGIELPK